MKYTNQLLFIKYLLNTSVSMFLFLEFIVDDTKDRVRNESKCEGGGFRKKNPRK